MLVLLLQLCRCSTIDRHSTLSARLCPGRNSNLERERAAGSNLVVEGQSERVERVDRDCKNVSVELFDPVMGGNLPVTSVFPTLPLY